MSNPWTKKNPWLSMWLSGANAVAGAARARATAHARREASTMMTRGAKDAVDFWTAAMTGAAPAKRTRKNKKSGW